MSRYNSYGHGNYNSVPNYRATPFDYGGSNRGVMDGRNWNGSEAQMGFGNQPMYNRQENFINALINSVQPHLMQNNAHFNKPGGEARFTPRYGASSRGASSRGASSRGASSRGASSRGASSRGAANRGAANRGRGAKRNFPQSSSRAAKKNVPPKKKFKKTGTAETLPEEEVEIPDEDVVVSDELIEFVEILRARTGEIVKNAVDEDIAKLSVFSFTGNGYYCETCDILMIKETVFANHLSSKNHAIKVIDARTAKTYQHVRDILEIDLGNDNWLEESELVNDILRKQAKVEMKMKKLKELREEQEYNNTPSNFYKFNLHLRKSITQKADEVTVTSMVESSVSNKNFADGDSFGCEFVKAVTGFHCRLCSKNIRDAQGVLPHLSTASHKQNYADYIQKQKDNQKDNQQRKKVEQTELLETLVEQEGQNILLSETQSIEDAEFLSQISSSFVRIPSILNPKKEEEKEPTEEGTEAEDGEGKDGEGSAGKEMDAENDGKEPPEQENQDQETAAEEEAPKETEEAMPVKGNTASKGKQPASKIRK